VTGLSADPPNTTIARLLGVSHEGGDVSDLGFGRVGAEFIRRAIAAVGNYGEIYDRTIGDAIPRACTLNALASDASVPCPPGQGGIMYALPYR
jgi:general L-amino acid transport system substrate-binding protein